jgi:hypothetical protein
MKLDQKFYLFLQRLDFAGADEKALHFKCNKKHLLMLGTLESIEINLSIAGQAIDCLFIYGYRAFDENHELSCKVISEKSFSYNVTLEEFINWICNTSKE